LLTELSNEIEANFQEGRGRGGGGGGASCSSFVSLGMKRQFQLPAQAMIRKYSGMITKFLFVEVKDEHKRDYAIRRAEKNEQKFPS